MWETASVEDNGETGIATEASSTDADDGARLGTKRCFIICPIGSEGSDVRKRSDIVKHHVVDKAVEPLGYRTVRADLVDESGAITTQIISALIEADLVIADLTGHNANVFYELAIRHAFAKPFVQIIEDGEEIPFDVSAYRTVKVNYKDLDSAENAVSVIQRMVRELESGTQVETPVVHALNRQALGSSANPEKRELAQIGESLESLRGEMKSMANLQQAAGMSPTMRNQMNTMGALIKSLSERERLLMSDIEPLKQFITPGSNFEKWIASLHISDRESF